MIQAGADRGILETYCKLTMS